MYVMKCWPLLEVDVADGEVPEHLASEGSGLEASS